jgi:hypothetical protein
LLYAKLEEEHGMARHAMAVYERATKAVLPEEMFEVRRISHFTFFIINFSILRMVIIKFVAPYAPERRGQINSLQLLPFPGPI